VTPDRRYKFSCNSADERDVWFDAVSSCIRGKQEQTYRDKQVLLDLLSPFSMYPKPKKKGKLARKPVEIPDWVWFEVSDFMGNHKAPAKKPSPPVQGLTTVHPGLVVSLRTALRKNNDGLLSFDGAMKLLEDSRKSFLKKPLLLDVKGPIYVVGELHGDLVTLTNMFDTMGYPPEARYLFLGNVVGLGYRSLEVALLLLSLKLHYPEHIYIIRGKNEDQLQTRNKRGTLYDMCRKQYGDKKGRELWKEFVWLFDHMPICAVLNKTFFCVSSGLSQNLQRVDALRRGKIRPLYIARTNAKKYPPGRLIGSVIARDFLYNVPMQAVSFYKEVSKPTDKGLVFYHFGPNDLSRFLQHNKFTALIRGGQVNKNDAVFRNGYTMFAQDTLISLSSSANYNFARLKNKGVKGAVMFLEEEGEDHTFHTFKCVPAKQSNEPKIKLTTLGTV